MPGELFQIFYKIKAWDAEGVIIHTEYASSRSPCRAFLEAVLALLNVTTVTSIDITNTASGMDAATTTVILATGQVNLDDRGIVIGTSSTAMDIADYALGSQIAEGTGSGQMTHEAQTNPTAVTISGDTCYFTMERNFNNNSGSTITVREVGVYFINNPESFCMIRDIPTAVRVPNGGGVQVIYTLQISE